MYESLEQLKHRPIISSEEIEALHHELEQKHPLLSEKERALLFAQSIHQKLNASLSSFSLETQEKIKRQLIIDAVQKSDFCITALDLFECYTKVETPSISNMAPLTDWLNEHEHFDVNSEYLMQLAHILHQAKTAEPEPLSLSPPPIAEPIPEVNEPALLPAETDLPRPKWLPPQGLLFLLVIGFVGTSLWVSQHQFAQTAKQKQQRFAAFEETPIILPTAIKIGGAANHLQSHLQYKPIDESALKNWLQQKHSMLANEPYFSTIIQTAESFNINPLLLFAITGQEQSFVPESHTSAQKIANNPFNLYGSWQDYNTSIEDSARIAARTVINLAKDCPEQADQIQWINQQYAADPNWHKGVTYFLNQMEQVASLSHSN